MQCNAYDLFLSADKSVRSRSRSVFGASSKSHTVFEYGDLAVAAAFTAGFLALCHADNVLKEAVGGGVVREKLLGIEIYPVGLVFV